MRERSFTERTRTVARRGFRGALALGVGAASVFMGASPAVADSALSTIIIEQYCPPPLPSGETSKIAQLTIAATLPSDFTAHGLKLRISELRTEGQKAADLANGVSESRDIVAQINTLVTSEVVSGFVARPLPERLMDVDGSGRSLVFDPNATYRLELMDARTETLVAHDNQVKGIGCEGDFIPPIKPSNTH